jgi:Ca2+-binding RTX toxin-like protein
VRCPVDLTNPAIAGTEFEVATFAGDDRIDLRAMPDLPGSELTSSTEALYNGPGRPDFSTGGGDDTVLTGAYDTDGDLGNGDDRLIGGPGADGAAYFSYGGGLHGGRGRDRLIGGPGNDWLDGDLGDDFLKGDAGRDILVGSLGNDRLHSRDGEVDLVSCGPGVRSRQPIRQDRIDKHLRHEGRPAHFGCTPTP